jgi:hypothetical protein
LSTTNPTRPDPGLNPGLRGGKPATNRVSYGTAYQKLNRIATLCTATVSPHPVISWNSSVSIVTGYCLVDRCLIPSRDSDFPLSLHMQTQRISFPRVKWPEHEGDHSSPWCSARLSPGITLYCIKSRLNCLRMMAKNDSIVKCELNTPYGRSMLFL